MTVWNVVFGFNLNFCCFNIGALPTAFKCTMILLVSTGMVGVDGVEEAAAGDGALSTISVDSICKFPISNCEFQLMQ
jgi:hypothetical protein